MLSIALGLASLAPCQTAASSQEDAVRIERHHGDLSVSESLKQELLIASINLGLGPDAIERLFGPPLLQSQFRDGPLVWTYPKVTVYWPAWRVRPVPGLQRIRGGII